MKSIILMSCLVFLSSGIIIRDFATAEVTSEASISKEDTSAPNPNPPHHSPNPWELYYSVTEQGIGMEGMEMLKLKYPQQFLNVDITHLFKAVVTVADYKYTGVNTCVENDPRLRTQVLSMAVCQKGLGHGHMGSCSKIPSIPLAAGDPCLK